MDAKEFLENKGWLKDSPTVGGAFWMGMVEILEEYYQHKTKAENLPISDVSDSHCDRCNGSGWIDYLSDSIKCPDCR